MNIKIWIVAPFENMQITTEQVIFENDIELENCQIVVSNSQCDVNGLQGGLPELHKAQEWGAEVIVSRGGTATYIAERTDIPVVEIQVTALDILQAFRKSGNESQVGIAVCQNITYECESLNEFLGIRLHQIDLQDDYNYEGIERALKQGIKAVVGDALAIKFAGSIGIAGYLIESGKASLYKAIKEAEAVVKVRRKEQAQAELLRTVIDSSTDGIVAIDDTTRITLFNKVAEELFHVSRNQAIRCPVNEIIPNTRLPYVLYTGQSEIAEIQTIDTRKIATQRFPIRTGEQITGAVATFQEISQLQRYEQSVRQKLHDKGLIAKCHLEQIVGDSPAMEKVKKLAGVYASTGSTVLITGESGTGKELFAQSIHNFSSRCNAPFVAVNCAALPETLLESELFGYEEGAFSGAKKGGKIGLVELAHGGTLFLDEIGEMPLSLQSRILRTIQEKEVMRLGGQKIIPVDLRIIGATNQDLERLVANKIFREDLYYRLNVLPLHLPPLRERSGDIGLLAEYFIRKLKTRKSTINRISDEAVQVLKSYPWSGNVREFANVMERLVLLSPGETIEKQHVEEVLNFPHRISSPSMASPDIWSLVDEYRKNGMGARKIATILAQKGYEIKYYQVAYHLDKTKKLLRL